MGNGKITREEAQRREDLFKHEIKVCGTCKKELPLDMFTKDITAKYGLSSLCKECQREQRKRRKPKIDEWLLNNQERVKDKRKQYSKENSDKKRKYNQDNKEHLAQKRKEYEENNKEKVRQQRRKSRHSLSTRYKKYKREAEERNFDFELTIEEFDEITKSPCFYCGELPEDEFGNQFTGVDRIDSQLGYYKNNCVPCCFICNRMKSNYKLEFWLFHIKTILYHMEQENHIVVKSRQEISNETVN